MLDLKAVRDDPSATLAALERRNDGSQDRLLAALELDSKRRELLPQVESLRAQQNQANDAIAASKRDGGNADEAITKMKAVAAEGKLLKEQLDAVQLELDSTLAAVPNPPSDSAADADTVISSWGTGAAEGKDHVELAGDLLDLEAGARLSGARFAYLKGDLVRLELAIIQYVLAKLSDEANFVPVIPPVLVRERALYGTGFLPDTEQQIYRLADDDLYLVGTSEVALASLHDGEILELDQLPLRYAGYSPCFRREAGAAGKDTHGIFRVHQFDKVEMFIFCLPEDGEKEHERVLAIEESIMQELQIPYRVVNIAVDDLGASAAKKYDIEAWLPSQQQYRELTSCSNTTDYQARRLGIRVRREDGQLVTPYTINGTATALGRTIIAILENHQGKDGVVNIPAVLHKFGSPATIGAP